MVWRRAALAAGTAIAKAATQPRVQLLVPESTEQFDATRAIFREYAQGLGVDLCFQNFEAELASLPGEVALLRAEYERLDRALGNIRAGYEELLVQQADARAPYEHLLQDVGPTGLGVARRLTRISKNHPGPASVVHRALRLGLGAKRRVAGR